MLVDPLLEIHNNTLVGKTSITLSLKKNFHPAEACEKNNEMVVKIFVVGDLYRQMFEFEQISNRQMFKFEQISNRQVLEFEQISYRQVFEFEQILTLR